MVPKSSSSAALQSNGVPGPVTTALDFQTLSGHIRLFLKHRFHPALELSFGG